MTRTMDVAGGQDPSRRTEDPPVEEDDAPYRRGHSPAGGRILRGKGSPRPHALAASHTSRVFGFRTWPPAAALFLLPPISLTQPPPCASSDVCRYSIMASSSWSDRLLITLLCSTLCSRGTNSARILR